MVSFPGGIELTVIVFNVLLVAAIIGGIAYLIAHLAVQNEKQKREELEQRVTKLEAKHDSQDETERAEGHEK